jgi:methionyl-tRNA formyltransferase
MGTPEFAVPSLQILVENNFEVVAVITSADKLGGRGRKQLIESPIKKYAVNQGIDVLQPTNLKSPKFVELLKSYEADLQVVVAFRMLPEVVWNMPRLGTMNLHGSLLPKYRGAAPIHWAVIKGEKETGCTTFLLKHEIDTGDLLLQSKIPIDEKDNTGVIHDKMIEVGAELVLKSVKAIESGDFTTTPQDPSLVSKAPKLFKENTKIDFNNTVEEVYNFVRGLNPYPGAWTTFNEIEFKVFECEKDYQTLSDGKFISNNKDYLKLACSDGFIDIKNLQVSGKKRMNIKDLLNGYNFKL